VGLRKLFVLGYAYVIGFMFVVFCPVIIQLICAIVFLFIVLPMRNFYARPGEEKLAASGSLDFEMNDGRSVISRQDLRMGENNSIPANKYKSMNSNNNNNGGTQAFISAHRDDSETNVNSSNNSVSESIDHRLSSV
jgi:hypothetical protein